jgi:hypothetical protein
MRAAEPSAAIHLGVYGSVLRKELDTTQGQCEMSSCGAIYVSVIRSDRYCRLVVKGAYDCLVALKPAVFFGRPEVLGGGYFVW